MPVPRLLASAAALACAGALLSGCTAPEPDSPAPVAPVAPPVAEPLWSVSVDLVGWPEVAGDTVVSYVKDAKGLGVAAWDLATGEELWRRRAVPGHVDTRLALDVDVVEAGDRTSVGYLEQAPAKSLQRMVVADVRTGKPRTLKPSFLWATSSPETCPDGGAFCLTGWRFADWKYDLDFALRADPVAGTFLRDAGSGLPPGARFLGERVFASYARGRGREDLGLAENGEVAWRRSYVDVFGPHSTSDTGWWWEDDDDRSVVIGNGWPDRGTWKRLRRTGSASEDASDVRTVGLDRATGETLWSIRGAELCHFVDLDQWDPADPVVLCRINSGTMRWKRTRSGTDFSMSGYDVDVIGIDPTTGEERWSVPIGGMEYQGDQEYWFAPQPEIVVSTESGVIRIDHRSGVVSEVGADEVLACRADRDDLVRTEDGEKVGYRAGEASFPCDSHGKRLDSWTVEAVESVGVDAGEGRWVVDEPDRLLVVRT